MDDQSNNNNNNNNQNLSKYLNENTLPCFSKVSIIDSKSNIIEDDSEIVYLYREFEADCLLTKCYSNILQTYLLAHRPSYVPSESELTLTINNEQSNIQYLFSDIVSIPLSYTGLFEIFSSNSIKTDGILDHEKDIASLVTRLIKPKYYYVNKEMRVYEISPDKMAIESNNMHRKWTKISQGSVCKAIRVVSIDYEDINNSFLNLIKKVVCCNRITKKTDFAIEMKVIENFQDLSFTYEDDESIKSKNFDNKAHTHARLSKANIVEKTLFLPVYESSGSNEEIDLIPISSMVKNKKLNLNSLQLAKNFASSSKLEDNFIELKLFEENAFKKKNLFAKELSDLMQENQHLELEKYMSIYDLVDFRKNCKIIIGYSFSKKSLIFIPKEPIDLGLNKKCIFSKIDKEYKDEIAEFFRMDLEKNFKLLAETEIEEFGKHLNKIETFAFKKKNFEGLKMNEIEEFFVKPSSKPKKLITHFSDLVTMDPSVSSVNKIDFDLKSNDDKIIEQKTDSNSQIKTKYNTLPRNHSSTVIDKNLKKENSTAEEMKDNLTSMNKTEAFAIHVKRTKRAYSLPVDKAYIIKKYLSSKIQDSN